MRPGMDYLMVASLCSCHALKASHKVASRRSVGQMIHQFGKLLPVKALLEMTFAALPVEGASANLKFTKLFAASGDFEVKAGARL